MVTKLVTPLKVNPSDWLTNPNSISKPWLIWYRYQGKLVKLMGMNREKNYSSRIKLTLQLIKDEEQKLQTFGYNPISKTFLIQPPTLQETVTPDQKSLSFIEALNLAYKQLKVEPVTLSNIKSCIKYVALSAEKIGIASTPIDQIRRKHLKLLMNDCETERKLSARNYNAYRSYLMMLFQELDELEMLDHNPAEELKKKKEILKPRMILTPEEREKVKEHLKIHHPTFYRFVQIFFHSGSRRTELLSLRVKDVNLSKGEYQTLVKKGSQRRIVTRVIKDIAKPFWIEQLSGALPDDFVFSVDLLPGKAKIREEQITRRWKRHVKDKLNIEADLYSLKHLNTDEIAALLSLEEAAKHNGHTSTVITSKHYAIGEQRRQRERLKSLMNKF